MALMDELIEKVKGKEVSIVFPEATDVRILGAAARLYADGVLKPVLIGNVDEVNKVAGDNSFDIEGIEIIDPETYPAYQEMVDAFVERRRGKATELQAREGLKDPNYFATMLVYMDQADGMVSGAVGTTGDTIRPALQIIKTKPGTKIVSGSILMLKGDERYVFADCAVTIDPDAEQLADIAVESAYTGKLFGIDPKVAMLSFSTKGSAGGEQVEKVQEATKIAQEKAPVFDIDGELQFDAAYVESVGASKAPGSNVAGKANVFVFPDLQSGNIGYKIAQRLGGYEAVGPILQGLNKPVNDLSRGCDEEDVYNTSIITAIFALEEKK